MADIETQQVQAEETQPQQTAPNLSLQDLVTVAQIIQITTQRGAFRAEELENVGALYNKLVAFLETAGAIQRSPAEGEQENPNV